MLRLDSAQEADEKEEDKEEAEEANVRTSEFSIHAYEKEEHEKAQHQDVPVNVSTPASDAGLHAYAYYSIAAALLVLATCWYSGTVVEKLNEASRSK